MAKRYGPETGVIDWSKRLVCSLCGSHDSDMVVTGTARRWRERNARPAGVNIRPLTLAGILGRQADLEDSMRLEEIAAGSMLAGLDPDGAADVMAVRAENTQSVCERLRRDGGSVFTAHAKPGAPNGPLEV